ncbi:MAG TPA: DNA polymerase I [Stellaceae bacterium]|nr:DNA polymerase I [Stellaceae bacterium]
MSAPKHVYLIDGSGFIFRAYHALPPLTRPDGTPVGAVLGFTNMLLKLLQDTDADHIAVVFDSAATTFRNRLYDQYKANRPELPPDLVPQFKLVRAATDALSICRIEQPDYEADDLIATYAREGAARGATVTIVSSDKDMMQLISDRIAMLDPIKMKPIGEAEVREKFGVGPDKVIEVQALIGDSVDNVPGVPGIGAKTAAELITAYGDVETLLARAGEIKQPKRRQTLIDHAEEARLSKKLVTLDDHVPLPCPIDDLAVRPLDAAKVTAFLQEQNFRSLLARLQPRLTGGAASPSADAETPAVHPSVALADAVRRYELVQDAATLDRWIDAARAQGAVAIHAETSSPDRARGAILGIALALAPGEACYIPLGHCAPESAGQGDGLALAGPSAPAPKQITREEALRRLQPLLEEAGVLKIGHNIKEDIAAFANSGIALGPIDCAMLMSFVLEAGAHGHSLEELAQLHFGHETVKYKDVAGSGRNHIGFAAAPLEKARDYAAENADYALRLHRLLKPRLIAEHMLAFYETIERPLVAVVAAMEAAGIRVDRAELERLSRDFARRIGELEGEIHKLAGHPFNIGSPKQLGEVLFDELKLPGGRKMKTGAYGTDAGILEELALSHDLPARVLDWRQFSKLKSTYTDALIGEINPQSERVHTSFSLTGAATGRLSSNDPNLQNIPIRTEEGRKIRRAFVAAPGHRLVSADYSQIELRLAAHVAGIDALKEAFRAGADIHAMTASEVFGVPMAKMDGETRRRAKAINFGIIYGISAFGLGQQLGVPQGEAADYIKRYFQRFPGIRDYMERMKQRARERGYVETLFGRRVHIPGIKDANPARRGFSERAAINAPLQGSAADIIKRAMRRMPGALSDAGLKARMLLQVHDELVFEAPEQEVEATRELAKTIMEGACAPVLTLSVPLVVETGAASNWEEAH